MALASDDVGYNAFLSSPGTPTPTSVAKKSLHDKNPVTTENQASMMQSEELHSGDLFAEAERHLLSSEFIYLYSELRVLSGAGYAPFPLDDIDCKGGTRDGILRDKIFLSLLKTLRREDKDDPDGLTAALKKEQAVVDLKQIEEYVEQGLVDRGDPVEMCPIDGVPLRAVYAKHQHVGSQANCLCAKYGLHHTQVMLDHLVRSEDEKRAKEAEECATRPPRSYMLKEGYQQLFCQPILEPATSTEEKEDAQIDNLPDGVLIEMLKQQLNPDSYLLSALNNPEKIVHINDMYPTKECVYIVSCDKINRTIKVNFRGTVSLENWLANFTAMRVSYPNPIQDKYPGRTESIELHKGFSTYLLRKRKDTGQSKFDEILDKVKAEGQAAFGSEKYRLVCVGHSLGGALATIFGFYASASESLEAKKPVDIFSFCSPKPGSFSFASAFHRQEQTRNARHFRFFHNRDIVVRHFEFECMSDVLCDIGLCHIIILSFACARSPLSNMVWINL